jgi:uncharacterized membrane protein (UPF0182 family)
MNSGSFRLEEGGRSPERSRRQMTKFFVLLAVVLFLFAFGTTLFQTYADWLWFTHDARQPDVYAKTFKTRALLWLIGLAVSFFAIYLNARASLDSQAIFDSAPSDENARAAAGVLAIVQKFARLLAIVFALIVGFGIASSFGSSHMQLWASKNAVPFGRNDPLFGLDIGFFVFKLPWYATIVKTVLSVLVFSLVVTLIGYLGSSGLAKVARVHLTQKAMRTHVSVLAGLTIVVYGVQLYLSRYFLAVHEGSQFVGPGYAQSRVVPFYAFLGIAAIVLGALTMVNAKLWKPWRILAFGVPALVLTGVVLLGIYPSVVQQYIVKPNSLTLELPYVKRAIEGTRFAYGLDKFEVRDFNVSAEPTQQEVAEAQTTLQAMRLWDPDVLRRVFEERQTLRSYYNFFDVDVDRYTVNGEQRMVMLSPRDIQNSGLDPKDQNWQNQHLRYTHGFGVVVSPVNETVNAGDPRYWLSNFPPQQGSVFPVEEQRIYFSNYPAGTLESDSYVLLNTKLDEFDYPADPEALHKWTESRGIPIAGALAKFVFSALFGEISFYTTSDIVADTRLIYRRNIIERASLVYPFLSFDSDPYVVIVGGRVLWILDAYTVSDMVPYSDFTEGVNYIRNSVKIVVDSYTGDMDAYAVEEGDPILQTWMKVFPGLVRPNSEVPADVRAHFRYAEGLFGAQSAAMARYHVTDSRQFLSNEDAWQVALEKDSPQVPIEPYYVQMRVPGEDVEGFMLIRPFSTRTKNNMIGWMAAFCDPDDYGRVVVFRFPRDTQTQGPVQIDAKFTADPIVADINRQFNNEQSSIVAGNLLVIPIGSSLLYVKPLFLESKSRPIPELRKVVLGLQNRVVVADSYAEALQRLFGTQAGQTGAPTPDTQPDQPEQPAQPDLRAEIAEVIRLLDQAQAAQRAGEWGRYGELQKQVREKLEGLAK